MYKNRFLLFLGAISILLVALAISKPLSKTSPMRLSETTDFYQRHPDWMWAIGGQEAVIPLTGDLAYPDYYQRHPELSKPADTIMDKSDYFLRHPELVKVNTAVDLSDYFLRHPELRTRGVQP